MNILGFSMSEALLGYLFTLFLGMLFGGITYFIRYVLSGSFKKGGE